MPGVADGATSTSTKRKLGLSALWTDFTERPLPGMDTSKEAMSGPCTISCRLVFIPTHQLRGSTRQISSRVASGWSTDSGTVPQAAERTMEAINKVFFIRG